MPRTRKNRRYNEETNEEEGERKFDLREQIKSERFDLDREKHLQELSGSAITLEFIQRHGFERPILVTKPDGLELRVPPKGFLVRDVRDCVGHERVIDVMDVRTQKNIEMSMKEWCKYYESKRRARLLNVISLEFSHTELDELVDSPTIVKLLDWVELAWPRIDRRDCTKLRKHCLMTVKGSYVDFRINCGGASSWYHILRGRKIFWMVPPTELNLSTFEEWTLSGVQQDVFFGDTVEECFRVELCAGNTFFIPSGWIHAVYTVEDSLVFGGNFLHSFGIENQLKVSKIEDTTKVPIKFRYPFYTEILWYVVQHYVHCLTGRHHSQPFERPEANVEAIDCFERDDLGSCDIGTYRNLAGKHKRKLAKHSNADADKRQKTQLSGDEKTRQQMKDVRENLKVLLDKQEQLPSSSKQPKEDYQLSRKTQGKNSEEPTNIILTSFEINGLKALMRYLRGLDEDKKGVPYLINDPDALLNDCANLITAHDNDLPRSPITGSKNSHNLPKSVSGKQMSVAASDSGSQDPSLTDGAGAIDGSHAFEAVSSTIKVRSTKTPSGYKPCSALQSDSSHSVTESRHWSLHRVKPAGSGGSCQLKEQCPVKKSTSTNNGSIISSPNLADFDSSFAESQPEPQLVTTKISRVFRGVGDSATSRTILNEALLIRNRSINFNQKTHGDLELLSEDKVSKYKLEEVHCSVPSSIKSTFIMTFSPDSRRVASTHGDNRIYICDLNTGKLLYTLEGHPKTPWCLAWHPSNRNVLASGCLAGDVRVWDLKSKACESWTSDSNTIITSVDFHPQERILVIATGNDILFWDWSESQPFARTRTVHEKEKVKFVVFDSSGTNLITGINNLPKFSGYSNDSLQNRIIDSYMSNGNVDPIQTDNMTQNSETPQTRRLNSSSGNASNDRNKPTRPTSHQLYQSSRQPAVGSQSVNSNSSNERETSCRSTITLTRVALLYRQLEALEDSMRHTSFTPFVNSRPVETPAGRNQSNDTTVSGVTTEQATSQGSKLSDEASGQPSTNQSSTACDRPTSTATNPFEPLVVSFDESLEHLQLRPLIVDGLAVNLSTIMEEYPIDARQNFHYMMQLESIIQVNQNFIRISKLMHSIRLYRQIVQQITTSNSGQGHYQPNQILTAQSTSPLTRQARNPSNLPVIFRNVPMSGQIGQTGPMHGIRATDPIMAIQFRNSARNVPLAIICKIDLLAARSVCIMRSQQLIEQTSSGFISSPGDQQLDVELATNSSMDDRAELSSDRALGDEQSTATARSANILSGSPFYMILFHLYQTLTHMNHAPLTTSNVHTHISSLRTMVNKLLNHLASMFHSDDERQRLPTLIHDIAHSLTGRSWNIPLGATLDDIRLDVIHTICIIDMALHLTRQVQLLQMQRIAAIERIHESNRTAHVRRGQVVANAPPESPSARVDTEASQVPDTAYRHMPSTSRSTFGPHASKRTEIGANDSADKKKRKVDDETTSNCTAHNPETNMIDITATSSSSMDANSIDQQQHLESSLISSQAPQPMQVGESLLPADRLLIWNSTPTNQIVESGPQRLLVATSGDVSNSHILVRIYNRLYGNGQVPQANLLDGDVTSAERMNHPQESRRRALSQDNQRLTTIAAPDMTLEGPSAPESLSHAGNFSVPTHATYRIVNPNTGNPAPGLAPLNQLSGSMETWQRQPHLHLYQARGNGQHLWFNYWTIPSFSGSNYRLQCWNFSPSAIPNIKDSQSNLVTQKCRIYNDSSVDLSKDGSMLACLVPRDDNDSNRPSCLASFDLKIFSLRPSDFGACYYQLPQDPNTVSVSLSPTASYVLVGLASHKYISNDPNEDDLTIAKIFNLRGRQSCGHVRDIKIKRDDSSLSLNAIRWLPRGIVYNVGPQHHQRQAARWRNRYVGL